MLIKERDKRLNRFLIWNNVITIALIGEFLLLVSALQYLAICPVYSTTITEFHGLIRLWLWIEVLIIPAIIVVIAVFLMLHSIFGQHLHLTLLNFLESEETDFI